MNSIQKQARTTGVLYLIIILCAGFSEAYVRANVLIPGDATTTANNIIASSTLFRMAFVSDLIAFMCDAGVAVLLYVLLKPVNKTLSLAAASFRLLAHPAIGSINLLNHFAALLLVGDTAPISGLNEAQVNSLLMFFLEAHHYGYLIAGAFFGVHLWLLGYLLYHSSYFPALLGTILFIAGVGYLVESFGNFLFPQYEDVLSWVVAIPAGIGELTLCLWLLVKGVKAKRTLVLQ